MGWPLIGWPLIGWPLIGWPLIGWPRIGWPQIGWLQIGWPDRLALDRLALDRLALQETVSGLEYELATAWTKHGKLAEENVRLREQLRAAQRSLALAAERVRRLPVTDLDRSEVVLLQRLLATGGTDSPAGRRPDGSLARRAG